MPKTNGNIGSLGREADHATTSSDRHSCVGGGVTRNIIRMRVVSFVECDVESLKAWQVAVKQNGVVSVRYVGWGAKLQTFTVRYQLHSPHRSRRQPIAAGFSFGTSGPGPHGPGPRTYCLRIFGREAWTTWATSRVTKERTHLQNLGYRRHVMTWR